jgi:hypothetical protein
VASEELSAAVVLGVLGEIGAADCSYLSDGLDYGVLGLRQPIDVRKQRPRHYWLWIVGCRQEVPEWDLPLEVRCCVVEWADGAGADRAAGAAVLSGRPDCGTIGL